MKEKEKNGIVKTTHVWKKVYIFGKGLYCVFVMSCFERDCIILVKRYNVYLLCHVWKVIATWLCLYVVTRAYSAIIYVNFFFEKVYVNVFMCIVKGYKKFFWLPHRVHVMCVYEIVYNNRE